MKARLISLLSLLALVGAAIGLFISAEACADSWAPPETETILSANGQYRFTVEPADIGSQLDFFREEVIAEQTGKKAKRPMPLGLLERRSKEGKWEPVWAGPLANPVAPVVVLVADDGRHVVTFDNWHSVGHGEHVVVIYGAEGKLVRSMALTDLVPQDYIDALPHSVSSVQWREREAFSADGAKLIVSVLVPTEDRNEEDPDTIAFVVTLADGSVVMPPADAWAEAKCAADQVNEQQRQAEAERIAYLTAPLSGPKGCELGDWHQYLNEAHARLSKEPVFEASTSTTVLFPRDHPRHDESVEWLLDEVADVGDFPTSASFVSPCDPDGMVAAFAKTVKRLKPGSAANATYYIAAPEPQFAAIARLVAPTGAKTVWLDPAAAIPQRPDRIPGSPEHDAAIKAHLDGLAAEVLVD